MTTAVLVKKVNTYTSNQFGKKPVVVLPINMWEEIQEHMENLEMLTSKKLAKDVKQSRLQIKKGRTIALEDL